MARKARLVLNDPAATGVDDGQDYLEEALAKLPRGARKFAQKRIVKDRVRTVQRVVTEADIPPGSVLSDQTIEAIRAGKYALAVDRPVATSPVLSKKPLIRKRRQMAKQSRKHNRRK